jgi:hypothetical protein
MPTDTEVVVEERYRVECSCGRTSGNFEDREQGDRLMKIHEKNCDGHCEVTPGLIPGYE